ncbi:MAG: membrane protein insertase YidC [Verrucomicrobiota bacterium]|nr:membrane protein insertase YidC [Verrucomicrobiota bacterium]
MDRTGKIVVALCAILFVAWLVMQQKYAARMEREQARTHAPAATQTETPAAEAAAPPPATTAPGLALDTNLPEQTLTLTNARARYVFTSRGGGLKSVALLDYPETVSPRWQPFEAAGAVATLNARAPLPALAILGSTNLTGNGQFTLTRTDDGVRAEKSLPDGLRLVKEFHLSSNYLVTASVTLVNTTARPLSLPAQEWVIGTAAPMDPDDNNFPVYGGAMWFDGAKDQTVNLSYFSTNTTVLLFFPRTPKMEYRAGASNVVWAAAYNQFFTIIAMPQTPAGQVVARPVTLPPYADTGQETNAPVPQGIQAALVYPAQVLEPHQSVARQLTFFAGPKEYRLLARIGEQFHNHADLVMNFGTGLFGLFGVGTFFAKLLLLMMNWLHDATRMGYGLAIVVITVLLRLFFWPFTAAGMRSMKRMQALAPELKALKEKYKDDMQKLMQKQQELYRKHKINPMGGCLPMLIQMPVFVGFYTMLRSAIELRGAHFLWVADLTKPDTLFMIPGLTFIPIFSTPVGLPFNLLPLLMVGAMVWQAHLQPPSPGMDPTQQKMMRYMPLIFLLFLYNYSSGMSLYMTFSTLMSVLQTRLTRLAPKPAAPGSTPALTPPQKKKK